MPGEIHGTDPPGIHLARQKGFEPLTYCLEGSCSILLSYWRISASLLKRGAGDGNRTHVSSLEGWCSTIELHLQLDLIIHPGLITGQPKNNSIRAGLMSIIFVKLLGEIQGQCPLAGTQTGTEII